MRSVVAEVIVSVESGGGVKLRTACQLQEKYPSDWRWRCGACNLGWVKPFEGDTCTMCPARVIEIVRDEGQTEIMQAIFDYDRMRADMVRDYQVQGTRSLPGIIGPIPTATEMVLVEKKKRPKKEKKPKPAKAPVPGVRQFRSFPE
jgi:hypothetical protein